MLTIPITILSLGLFLWVINAGMIGLVAWMLKGFHVAGFGAALLGAVCGSYRGGIQIAFAAVKMPALFLVPLLVALPAVHARAGVSSGGAEVTLLFSHAP